MKTSELRQNTRQELEERLVELREELFNLRFRMAAHQQLENPLAIRSARREIAQVITILKEDAEGVRTLPTSAS